MADRQGTAITRTRHRVQLIIEWEGQEDDPDLLRMGGLYVNDDEVEVLSIAHHRDHLLPPDTAYTDLRT